MNWFWAPGANCGPPAVPPALRLKALDDAALPHASALGISSNPLESEVLAAAGTFKDFGADLVLGVGGGSVLDVAKLVRLAATHPEPLAQYDDAIGGSTKITEPLPPMIAIPTTATIKNNASLMRAGEVWEASQAGMKRCTQKDSNLHSTINSRLFCH